MKLTLVQLRKERVRAIKEHTPMKIHSCRRCKQILNASSFSKSGREKGICRDCARIDLEERKASGAIPERNTRYSSLGNHTRDKCSSAQFKNWFEKETREEPHCFYCGQPLDLGHRNSLTGLTIDRMDNTQGYLVGNMVLSCRRCNIIKGSWFSFEEMLEIAEKYLKD